MTVATIALTGDAAHGVGPAHARSAVAALPLTVKLGRARPAALPMVPRFEGFHSFASMAVAPPARINRHDKAAVALARMYLNDRYGCCVIAGKAHALGVVSANDSDSAGEIQATDQEIYSQYQSICGRGDNGCVITRVLDVMRSRGFQAGGKRYLIDGYVAVDWTDEVRTKVVQYLFGATTVGINLPQAWTESAVWDVTNSKIVGGHDVTAIDYDERGVYVSSWGRIYLMTWAAWLSKRWVEEYYAILYPQWYNGDKMAPCGVDVAGLKGALEKLAHGELPTLPDDPKPDPIPAGKRYELTTDARGVLTFVPV